MSPARRADLRARESALRQSIATLNRQQHTIEREEDARLAELEAARLRAESRGVLPGGGGVQTLAVVELERRDFEKEIADIEAELDEIGKRIGEAAVAAVLLLLEDLTMATEAARAARAVLGEAAIPLFTAVLAADDQREEALAAVASVERDFRGDRRVVSAQRAAVKRYCRDLLAGATQAEIIGLFIYQVLTWARRGSTPLEPTWAAHDVPLLPGSVMQGAPVIGGVVRDGPLPL